MIYTPLEAEILSILKDNIEQENGIPPESLLSECAAAVYVKKTLPDEAIGDLVKTLVVLVAEGLVNRIEGHNEHGVYSVIGYEITRDGLRAFRSLSS